MPRPNSFFKLTSILMLSVSPVALLAQAAPMASGDMEDLGTLVADDSSVSGAYGMTPDGETIVGMSINVSGYQRGAIWSGAGVAELGTLGGLYSNAWAVNSDGSVVVGLAYTAAGRQKAVRWVNGVIQDIDNVSIYSDARGVSADGAVVVGNYYPGAEWQAFRWTEAGGIVDLGFLSTGSNQSTEAYGVSADGSIVLGRSIGLGGWYRPFMWTEAGGLVDLGTMRADNTGDGRAIAISADNSTIVGQAATETVGSHAFRWTAAGGMQDLGDLSSDGTEWSIAQDVTPDGAVIVGAASDDSGNNKAFIWRESTGMQNLGTLRSDNSGTSNAWAVSDDGTVVAGWSQVDAGGSRAFIWTADEMLDHENTLAMIGQSAAEQAAAVTAMGQMSQFVLGQEVLDLPANGGGGVLSSKGQARNPVTLRVSLGAAGNEDGDARVAGLTAATALADGFTLGGYVGVQDYGSDLGGFDTDGSFGSFGVYLRRNAGGAGWTWKLAAAHLGGDAEITRAPSLTNTEAGTGTADMSASSVLAEVGFGMDRGGVRVTPFGRLSHTRARRDGYTEGGGIAFPVSYDDHEQTWTVLTLGLHADMAVGPQGMLRLSAGGEFDLDRSENAVTGTSAVPGMTTFSVDSPEIVHDNRAFAAARYLHRVSTSAAVEIAVGVSQSAYGSDPTVTGSIGYQVRF